MVVSRDNRATVVDLIKRSAGDPEARRWYQAMLQADPQSGVALDLAAVREAPSAELLDLARKVDRAVIETIVSIERPVYFATPAREQGGMMSYDRTDVALLGPDARVLDDALAAAAGKIEPLIARVGRLDIRGLQGMPYGGTGWLIDDGVLVTNRHVAQVFGQIDRRRFAFRFGSGGRPLSVDWNTGHFATVEGGGISAGVSEILYIEPENGPYDVAFLRLVAADLPGILAPLPLASASPEAEMMVCAIGYPAKAPHSVIPDQQLMERLFRNTYDVKRLAPGRLLGMQADLVTHDCTTLGGNSGSGVFALSTGDAVGLHFAGLYQKQNRAVPAAVLADYRARRRWALPPEIETRRSAPVGDAAAGGGATVVTITITIASGESRAPAISIGSGDGATSPVLSNVEAAVCAFLDARPTGVVAARIGFAENGEQIGNVPQIAAAVRPEKLAAVRAAAPATFCGFDVRYEAASLAEQLEAEPALEAASGIAYDDEARKEPAFALEPVSELMTVNAHVSPDYGLDELQAFLTDPATKRFDSAIFEFDGVFIAEVLEAQLKRGVHLHLTIDDASLPRTDLHGAVKEEPKNPLVIDTVATVTRWKAAYGELFSFVKVPRGPRGLIKNSYHIKVTVRNDDVFWLSSGNWKNTSSLPVVGDMEREDALDEDLPGNREWHVIVANPTLAERFRQHICQDAKRSKELIGDVRASPESLFDVLLPVETEAFVEERRPPARIFKPLVITDRIRATPLLTPDREGRVYTDAVLKLMASARRQLWFQIPYISMRSDPRVHRGNIDELIDVLVDKLKTLDDARVILRTGNKKFGDNRHVAWYFKSRGIDTDARLAQIDDTHTKGMIVDGERVLIGSHNWSGDGVSLNRDASLIFDDKRLAAYFGDAFLVDWQRANPVKAKQFVKEASVLISASTPATEARGMRRMSLTDYLKEVDD